MVNVICMKWGTRYGALDVNILYAMVKRHTTLPFRFVCLTDDPQGVRGEVECFPIPDLPVPPPYHVSPWRKLVLFQPNLYNLEGKTLFLDLDIVIVANIDAFFTYSPGFAIIENWTQQGQGIGNSSVYAYTIGAHPEVYNQYMQEPLAILQRYDNEQIFLSKTIGKLDYWPDEWCKSFKRHCLPKGLLSWIFRPKQPAGAKIIVFHGDPKPSDAARGVWPKRLLKHVRPTAWILEHWHE